ncbi:MAG: hypothetical protein WCL29_06650, partial [Pseudomonadota bacterium]
MEAVTTAFPEPMGVAGSVATIKNGEIERFMSGGTAPEYFEAFKLAMEMPPMKDQQSKLDVLKHMAAGLYDK